MIRVPISRKLQAEGSPTVVRVAGHSLPVLNLSVLSLSMLSLSMLAVSGCVTPGTSDKDDEDDGSSATGTTIYDIQQGNVEPDSVVTLSSVIVTSDISTDGAGFFVSEADGGEYSGIYVFMQGTFADTFLTVGDAIDITGTYVEYYELSELTVTADTDISIVGSGSVEPTVVSNVSDWEPYEGVLVQLNDQEVQDCVNSYGEAPISEGLDLDDFLYVYDTERGATYTSLIGQVTYSFEAWKLLPRWEDDFVGYSEGPGCTVSVSDIQQGEVEEGTIELEEVVVTTEAGDSGFWVQDQGGGPYSGIYVYTYEDVDVDVSIGDVVNLGGSYVEYYELSEISVGSSAAVEVVGTAEPVTEEITSAPSDWEPYEGVLVTLVGVQATSDSDGYGEVETDFNIKVDDWFYDQALSDGAACTALTGVVTYAFEEWKLLPRGETDIECEGGSGNTGTDPDPASVTQIQDGTVGEGALVEVTGVVATSGLNASETGFFVQDAGGGAWSGVYIYVGTVTDGTIDVAVGDVLTIVGEVTEFYDLTEISVSSAADIVVTGSGSPDAEALSSPPSDWEAYEGCLVELAGVGITSDPDSYGEAATDWTDLYVDNAFFDYTLGAGDGADITGLITYSYSTWRVAPRDAGDIIPD